MPLFLMAVARHTSMPKVRNQMQLPRNMKATTVRHESRPGLANCNGEVGVGGWGAVYMGLRLFKGPQGGCRVATSTMFNASFLSHQHVPTNTPRPATLLTSRKGACRSSGGNILVDTTPS